MRKADRTPEQRAVDRIITQAMAFYRTCKGSELPNGKGIIGKLLRSCARLEKVWTRHRRYKAVRGEGEIIDVDDQTRGRKAIRGSRRIPLLREGEIPSPATNQEVTQRMTKVRRT